MYKFRHKLLITLIIILIIFKYVCQEQHKNYWIFLAFCAATLLGVDLMFLGDDQFIYDPDYKNWKNKVERELNYWFSLYIHIHIISTYYLFIFFSFPFFLSLFHIINILYIFLYKKFRYLRKNNYFHCSFCYCFSSYSFYSNLMSDKLLSGIITGLQNTSLKSFFSLNNRPFWGMISFSDLSMSSYYCWIFFESIGVENIINKYKI